MRSMLCIGLAVSGCFAPHAPAGAACAVGELCPDGQSCVLGHCVVPGGNTSTDAPHGAIDPDGSSGGGSSIAFVQQAYASSTTATVNQLAVPLPQPQAAGDLTIVFVSWFTPTISVSVADNLHDTFLQVEHAQVNGAYQLSMFYAANVTPGATTITATFSNDAAFPEVRVVQYRGAAGVDSSHESVGSNAMSSSKFSIATPGVLIVAGNAVQAAKTQAAGVGFTSRQITSFGGHIIEDQLVTTPGEIDATAPLTSPSSWVMAGLVVRPL